MASGARVVEKTAPVFAVLGDGTFGFHMSEIETAVRLKLPYVAIVGTDARWNAGADDTLFSSRGRPTRGTESSLNGD